MTAETRAITQDNHPVTEREMLADILARVDRIERNLTALLTAWSAGGMRGLRQAARENFATRPDPDGSRARFLADGLARLEDHDGRRD